MAKNWYPVIDYVTCLECGTCVSKCPHGVYDTAKAPSPIVLQWQNCIDHCHGCGNNCPVGAITYVGDDTGWTPPKGEQPKEQSLSCCCVGIANTNKKVLVEYLYLDLKTCDRCMGADKVLDEVLFTITPALQMCDYSIELKKVEIATAKLAQEYKFVSSPTIRVNGSDISHTVAENACGCCSDISGTDVDCRVFEYDGKTYEVPPHAMLAQAIMNAVFGIKSKECFCEDYVLPGNLKNFFEGKADKISCSCGGNC